MTYTETRALYIIKSSLFIGLSDGRGLHQQNPYRRNSLLVSRSGFRPLLGHCCATLPIYNAFLYALCCLVRSQCHCRWQMLAWPGHCDCTDELDGINIDLTMLSSH